MADSVREKNERRVTKADLPEILDGFEKNERVERLVLSPSDYVEPKELKRQGG